MYIYAHNWYNVSVIKHPREGDQEAAVAAPKQIIRHLKGLRKAATFESAGFYPFDADRNAEVKEVTRIYRETWVLPAIDELIEWAETGRVPSFLTYGRS